MGAPTAAVTVESVLSSSDTAAGISVGALPVPGGERQLNQDTLVDDRAFFNALDASGIPCCGVAVVGLTGGGRLVCWVFPLIPEVGLTGGGGLDCST